MMSEEPTGIGVLRRLNTASVLEAVRAAGCAGARITELTADTRLTRPTVAQAIEELVTARVVAPLASPSDRPVVGRPAMRYVLRPGLLPVLGLDVGPHRLAAGVVDAQGSWCAQTGVPVTSNSDPAAVRRQVSSLVTGVLRSAGFAAADIAAVVAGSPGVIGADPVGVSLAPSAPGNATSGVFEALARRFSGRLLVENDANLAAVAASQQYPDRTLVVVHWGERLGAGVVIDGRLHRGAHRAAGEVGMIPVSKAGVRFDENGRGPLEQSLGAAGIVARYLATAGKASDNPAVPSENWTAQDVFAAAAAGDAAAVTTVSAVAAAMIERLAPVFLAIDPDVVVFTGGISNAGEFLTEQLRRHLPRYTLMPPDLHLLVPADRAVLNGAVALAGSRAWDALIESVQTGQPDRWSAAGR